MTTRSASDFSEVMGMGPLCLSRVLAGSFPLSAQAQTPIRPSGDAKEQEPAETEDSIGPGRSPPIGRADVEARAHVCPRLGHTRSRITMNSALIPWWTAPLVTEVWRVVQARRSVK